MNLKKIKSFIGDIAIVSENLNKIFPFLFLLSGQALGNGMTVSLVKTFLPIISDAINGISSILNFLNLPDNTKKLNNEERFEVCFYLVCNQSYAYAMRDAFLCLKELVGREYFDENEQKKFESKSFSDIKGPKVDELDFCWDYDFIFSPKSLNSLFEIYNEYTKEYLIEFFSPYEIEKIISFINNRTKHNFYKFISTPEKPYTWIYRYILLKELLKDKYDKDVYKEIVLTIKKTTEGFLDENLKKSIKAWEKYRGYLKNLPNEKVFGSEFRLKDLYILANYSYYQAGKIDTLLEKEKKELSVNKNLHVFLSELISNRNKKNNLIFVMGEPGIGKTSFARFFAAGLAEEESIYPIYMQLQYFDPEKDILSEIEKAICTDYLRDAIDDLPYLNNLVFILDGFDELAQATRSSIGTFFKKLERFKNYQIYRNSSIIVLGRDTLFDFNDDLIPQFSHVINLLPFDKQKVQEWCIRWNQVSNRNFNALELWGEGKLKRGDIKEIITQPFLLYILAKLEEEGYREQIMNLKNEKVSPSLVYRHIVQWCCDRHDEFRVINKNVSLTGLEMRRLLRLIGFFTMAYGRSNIHIKDIEKHLSKISIFPEQVQKKDNFTPEMAILSFPFRKVGQASFEFKHRTFGEYFAAEYIASNIDRITTKKKDGESLNQFVWEMSEEEVVLLSIELFCPNNIPIEIENYLIPMLGNWQKFISGKILDDNNNRLNNLLKRCESMYIRFIKEKDLLSIINIAKEFEITPLRALANFGIAILILANKCTRSLSSNEESSFFKIEMIYYNSWYKLLTVILPYINLPSLESFSRLFENLSLESEEGLIFPENISSKIIVLPFSIIKSVKKSSIKNRRYAGSIFYKSKLEFLDLSEINFSSSNFYNASLKESNFSFSNLSGANFEKADLSKCILENTNLSNADLKGAKLIGANLTNANLTGANLEKADLTGATLNKSCLINANLKETKLKDAILIEANLSNALLYYTIFHRADLTNAIFKNTKSTHVDFRKATMVGIDFSYSIFDETQLNNLDLTAAILIKVEMPGINLSNSTLNKANLVSANLSSANLENTFLLGSDLTLAILNNANLESAKLNYSYLTRADLRVANLREAKMKVNDMTGANLAGADITGADYDYDKIKLAYLYGTIGVRMH